MRPVIIVSILAAATLLAACLPTPTEGPPATTAPEAATVNRTEAAPVAGDTGDSGVKEPVDSTRKQYSNPPEMAIDPDADYMATIKTNKGDIVVELLPVPAPKTVNNFVFLAEEGYYDGTIFHRVIPDFMIQAGDPTGTGTGGPGYRFEDEIHPSFVFNRAGILAMANSGPRTNGSQFFITTVPTTHLNGLHTIFGRVVQGQAVADAISTVATGAQNKPSDPVIIQGIEVTKSDGS